MKAILVINKMPNHCYGCQYCRFDARKYNFRGCVLTDTDVQDGTIDICKEVHSCCPLKPMPTKKKPLFDPDHCEIEKEIKIVHEIVGYNRCIDEIMGETKNETVKSA